MLRRLTAILSAAMLAVLAGASPAQAAPAGVQLVSASYAGTGCPAGSAAASLTLGGNGLAADYDSLIASAGPGTPTTSRTRNCELSATVTYPAGWQFALSRVTFQGGALLPVSVIGNRSARQYFSGSSQLETFQAVLAGPRAGDYSQSHQLGSLGLRWSPCTGSTTAVIQETVSLTDAANLRAFLVQHSETEKVSTAYVLTWRTCV